ncbi:hypothetical protein C7B62_18675 [Pleurocapsa sp. CCALA 161]|uniref:hypothetical protein n=1 Tax=Pleurocapsa sp. CCALA 161 TaxID=2107688 RepID=UPI000D074DEA|nr:hypothetical protein [Pleurocapsa sp. CCALA 161]PSB07862.1 hypothetical protein C7B62_18675 [Pleurocapsa sp. CCALA 161]
MALARAERHWFLCIVLGLLSLLSLVLLIWSNNKQMLLFSTTSSGLLSLAYSPLIDKPPLVRGLLILITIITI